ncbi:hypothetical protein [Rhodococcus sp. HNM0569]|uniref:hypothetical protein n=1 Tax=Rhodococcus sp. HNM0569 TaxID=2716340 RepID=UPI00146B8965|nr:hypothetical protein [Rhodococcus sp. HNM0569]NLU84126.1 hypothetical protein [Rhodococcus sp. HNM0569]
MSDATNAHPDALFFEPGGRWRTVAYGPAFCLVVLIAELLTGPQIVHWFAFVVFAALLAGLVAVQVVAARTHASVELTDTVLRQGTEELPVDEIAAVLPPADPDDWDSPDWESARALGELTGVPRRRNGIGLRLRGGGLVRAWARDDDSLRAALEAVVDRRQVGE